MADRSDPAVRVGPRFDVHSDALGLVVETDPPGVVPPGTSMIDVACRFKTAPIARRGTGWTFSAAELLPPAREP